MQTSFTMGKDAKIYQGTAGGALAALTEMSNVKDVTLTLEAGEADVTTRGNSGWRATAPTLRECTAEFEMLWQPGDSGFDAIKTAFLAGTTLELAPLTHDRDNALAQGPKGSFSITSFTRNEPLEEGVTVSVTAKLAVWDQWVEGSGAVTLDFTAALVAGAGEIDLAAVPYGIGSYDATGKIVTALTVTNNGANTLTVEEGAVDGYDLFGLSDPVVVPAAGTVQLSGAGGGAVAAGARLLTLTGTGAQTSSWTLVFEDE